MKTALLFASTLLVSPICLLAQDGEVAKTTVVMETSMGTIELELDAEKAPLTVANFLQYVDDEFYDNTIFHRVIDGFMVQGGGFDKAAGEQKEVRDPVQNEAKNGLNNVVGTVAMARTSDPHSASAQFFINVGDNASLDFPSRDGWGYAVFGRVVAGMDVVDEIRSVETGNRILKPRGPDGVPAARPMSDVPLAEVVIVSVRRKTADEGDEAAPAPVPAAE